MHENADSVTEVASRRHNLGIAPEHHLQERLLQELEER